jgi:hypothetical protein
VPSFWIQITELCPLFESEGYRLQYNKDFRTEKQLCLKENDWIKSIKEWRNKKMDKYEKWNKKADEYFRTITKEKLIADSYAAGIILSERKTNNGKGSPENGDLKK